MSSVPTLKVAVVGHTNTGKTSLLRTLTRNEDFGEVSDRPAVTREVEGTVLLAGGKRAIELYDTPGLEDSIGLFKLLHSLHGDSSRIHDGPELVTSFLNSDDAHSRFTQEAKALRQVLESDMALYVIDARDRVLGKHRDELEILAMCARPVVPVLNFVAKSEARTNEWRDHLARIKLHAVAEFDTVALDEHCEQRLYEKMRTLLPPDRAPLLDALIQDRIRLRERLIENAASLIADMLIDAAAHRVPVHSLEKAVIEGSIEQMRETIRDREQRCVDALLELHRFRHEDCDPDELPIDDGRWGIDLFSSEAMKQFGIGAGSGAAAGAMAGLVLDVLTGGLTLGAGTATGAALGGAIGGQGLARRLVDKVRGRSEVRCDNATLLLLEARQVALVQALLRRGHASMQPIHLSSQTPQRSELPKPLKSARARPDWSAIDEQVTSGSGRKPDPQRDVALRALAATVRQAIRQGKGTAAAV